MDQRRTATTRATGPNATTAATSTAAVRHRLPAAPGAAPSLQCPVRIGEPEELRRPAVRARVLLGVAGAETCSQLFGVDAKVRLWVRHV